ncbi:MAG: tryptophan synthase subunit alpha [Deltaproteobacteria bacterium]|jgi:tryptophan synthase alpha chain|nr:tryptophan synthase subunit alpha [Deltaproteobacteria bacterium]
MGRIERKFSSLRNKGEKAVTVYVTAGDPSLEHTGEIILGLDAAGVDILEIGVPFSDPTADGPTIQAASHRALQNGTTLTGILNMIESLRLVSEIPIVLFGYYNPIFIYGNERFAKRAKEAGVDGILVVDLPPEESVELRQYTDPLEIDFISLIAPTTGLERVRKISKQATGFLYYISITGVTGTAKPRVVEVKRDVERIREIAALPIVVGFGISTPQQAREIAPYVDGVVIGSAFVRLIEENRDRDDMVNIVSNYARKIKKSSNISATYTASQVF